MFGTRVLEERISRFNGKLCVVRSFGLGTYIQAGGLTQSGGIVETIWKQTLRAINNPQLTVNNCLILGLGGGTVAKLIRKNRPGAQIVGVDIDPVIVELGKKYMGLDAAKTIIKIQDAGKIVPGKFELVIVDLYHGDKFPKKFEDKKFLKPLTKNNLVIFNRLYYNDKKDATDEFGEKLKKVFRSVKCFRPISNMMFICSN